MYDEEPGFREGRRGKRIRLTTNKITRQKRIAKTNGLNVEHPHRFAKRHSMDCGQPRCVCCGNPRRIFGELTMQEKKIIEKEQSYNV